MHRHIDTRRKDNKHVTNVNGPRIIRPRLPSLILRPSVSRVPMAPGFALANWRPHLAPAWRGALGFQPPHEKRIPRSPLLHHSELS